MTAALRLAVQFVTTRRVDRASARASKRARALHFPTPVAFYIRKSLAHGAIRFGVLPRAVADVIDRTGSLSTGPRGEFLRKRHRGFFFAEDQAVRSAELPKEMGIAHTPFWKSVFDGTRQGWIYAGMIVFGILFVLLGLAVLAKKGAPGAFWIILAIALIATPLIRTAAMRRAVREREKRDRDEREARERRHREMLSAYTTALTRLREDPNDVAMAAVARERERLELPYDVWSPMARQTVLEIGFAALAKDGPSGAKDVSDLMRRASAAVGLAPSDELGVRLGLYRAVVWHLLADDRANETQLASVDALRRGLGIADGDVPDETQATEEFERLRGFTPNELPRDEPPFALGFHEYCVRVARGSSLKRTREKTGGKRVEKIEPDQECTVTLTNKRIIVDAGKRIEVPIVKVDDVELDADANVLTVRTARTVPNLDLRVEDPIFTGALIDLVLGVDERPKGFA